MNKEDKIKGGKRLDVDKFIKSVKRIRKIMIKNDNLERFN